VERADRGVRDELCFAAEDVALLVDDSFASAVAYDAAISDRVLLANIVRARDYVPLSITELSANQVAVCANDPIKTADGTFYIYPVSAAVRHAEFSPAVFPRSSIAKDWEDRLETFKDQCATGIHPVNHACHGVKILTGKPKSTSGTNAFASYSLIRTATGAGATAAKSSRRLPAGG
jgi:hypothetical protein